MIRILIVALLSLPLVADAACPDGDYIVEGEPLLTSPGGAFTRDVVTIADGTVAIASGCPAAPARIKVTKRGTFVRAAWPQCADALRGRLRAFVNPSCRSMRGRFVTRLPRSARRFVARQVPCVAGTPGCDTCRTNDDCAAELYCAKPLGECTAEGSCEPRPRACTREHVPVCGCDGVTYPNRCNAAANGASVAHAGPCTDERCGGIAGIECPAGEFCELPAGECRSADLQGRCVPAPGACPLLVYDPVCGCDGVTYGSDCERRAAKAQKAHDGRCRKDCHDACDCYRTRTFPEPCPLDCASCDNYWTCNDGRCVPHCGPVPQPPPVCEPKVCGGIAGIPCDDGAYCDLPAGACDSADLQGVCVETGDACPAYYDPVCGCDGVTYSNDCARLVAGAQKAHDGKCASGP